MKTDFYISNKITGGAWNHICSWFSLLPEPNLNKTEVLLIYSSFKLYWETMSFFRRFFFYFSQIQLSGN